MHKMHPYIFKLEIYEAAKKPSAIKIMHKKVISIDLKNNRQPLCRLS